MSATTPTSDVYMGVSRARVAAAASTNATSVKPGPANFYGFFLAAPAAAAAAVYLKIYDKASAPVVGTDVPVLTVPVVSTTSFPGWVEYASEIGIPLFNGFAYAITGAIADNDTTAVALNSLHGILLYK